MTEQGSGVREVKSAARTIELLEFLAHRHGSVVRLRDVAQGLSTPRSSAYALLQTLVAKGWVETDDTGTEYSVGIRALLAGTTYLDRDPFVRLVRPIIGQVSQDLGETIHMGRLDGDQVVYLVTAESHEYQRSRHRVGRRLPAAHTSLGKAILAARPDVVLDQMPQALTPHSLRSLKDLAADLAATRERDYAIDNEENTPGLRCFGATLRYCAPVRDSISCSVPLERLTPERQEVIIRALLDTRERIEAAAPVAVAL